MPTSDDNRDDRHEPTMSPLRLDQIERWMQAVITNPEGVEAGIGSADARREVDIGVDRIESVVDRSDRRTSIERLEVYANAYYARLLECLRDEFPALVHALGEEIFDELAFGYLQTYPSTSYTLSQLGNRFVQFLEETRPRGEAGEPDDDGPSWPDFMIDLVRLERTYSEVFDGPGGEKVPRLGPDQLRAVSPDQWPSARLVPVPCLRLLSLKYPVHAYATGVRKKENPSVPDPRPTWLAVSRIDYVVRRWTLSRVQFDLLQSLISGETIGRAIEQAARTAAANGESFDSLAQNLREWFEEWSAAGFFRAVEVPPGGSPK